MRLDKLVETRMQTTRKEMKRLFLMKRVLVDDKVELNPQRNVDSQLHRIVVNGEQLTTDHVYYLLNKPSGVVTAKQDAHCQTVLDLLASTDQRSGLYPVGRLDRDTTGLLLITDNGQLGYDLLQPKEKVAKTYRAVVNEVVTQADVAAFAKGIVFHGGVVCQPAELKILSSDSTASTVELTLHEGKFHQVKKMFLACGKKVIQLQRLTMGPLSLPAELAVGSYRSLTLDELKQLKKYFR